MSHGLIVGETELSSENKKVINKRESMKFVQFSPKDNLGEVRLGYLSDDETVVDLCCQQECNMPTKMLQVLKAGIADIIVSISNKNPIPLSSVILVEPISGMDKILCVGHNYSDHCKEIKKPLSAIPTFFSKFSSTIIGPNKPVKIREDVCKKVDWEVELAVVMGKTASSVKAEDAEKYIFGYTIAQDIGDREWQREKNGPHFLLGKAVHDCSLSVEERQAARMRPGEMFVTCHKALLVANSRTYKSQDTFCPIGPCIVTADEIGDVHNLNLSCSVNGVQKQKSNTSNLIHSVPVVIERVSTVMTLFPGDLILTGTPAGVGDNKNPPEYLQPGDVIRSEIQNIGVLETKVVKF